MKLARLSPTTMAYLVPMALAPLGVLVGSVMALQAPEPILPSLEPVKEVVEEPGKKRIYAPIPIPVTITLPNGLGTATMDLGVAIDKSASYSLLMRMRDNPQEAQTTLADAVLTMAEDIGPSGGADAVRRALPEILREAFNKRLVDMGEEPVVLEVYVLNWFIAD